MKKKYLVTGAAGFIGAVIAKKLIEANNDVWTIDNLSTRFVNNLPDKIKFGTSPLLIKSVSVFFKVTGRTHDSISLGRYNSTHKNVSDMKIP